MSFMSKRPLSAALVAVSSVVSLVTSSRSSTYTSTNTTVLAALLMYTQQSLCSAWKPSSTSATSIFLFHARPACFNPYKDLFSFHT